MPALFPLVFVLFAVLAVVLFVVQHHREKARREAMRAWAAARDFWFDPDRDFGFDNRFGHFEKLNQGSQRYAYNVAAGSHRGRHVWCFDYHHETYSTDSKGRRQTHHHHASNVIIDARMRLTPLSIRAEGFFDKVASLFGFDDIDFESAEFSRTFHVKSPDKRWAYDVVNQRNMETLLRGPRFFVELMGTHILVRRDRRFAPEVYGEALALGTALLEGIPRDVVAGRRLGENVS